MITSQANYYPIKASTTNLRCAIVEKIIAETSTVYYDVTMRFCLFPSRSRDAVRLVFQIYFFISEVIIWRVRSRFVVCIVEANLRSFDSSAVEKNWKLHFENVFASLEFQKVSLKTTAGPLRVLKQLFSALSRKCICKFSWKCLF